MKGVITSCIAELVEKKFGNEVLTRVLTAADLPKSVRASMGADIDDAKVIAMIGAVCKETNLSQTQVFDAFSEYWVSEFAPRMYGVYYRESTNARDFLSNMGKVHEKITASMPNARPPKFDYSWPDTNTMLMGYQSDRGLIDLLVSLAKAVGTYYNTPLQVTKVSSTQIKVTFPKGS
jgi:hypothetical protein